MDNMTLGIVLCILAWAVILGIYLLVYFIGTNILIKKHQKEWDSKRKNLIYNGATEEQIDSAFLEQMEYLIMHRSFFGACIPAKWNNKGEINGKLD